MLTQRDNEDRNINDVVIDDMEELMDSSRDSAVCSLASVNCEQLDSESDTEIINARERYKPMVEDIGDDDE